jgi:CubicO group peptidase (beta-lactamase class C family)
MIKIIIFSVFLTLNSFIVAQTVQTADAKAAEQFKVLYNQKKFVEIYALLSPEFRKQLSEKEFTDFLNKNIYNSYSELDNNEFLNKEKEFQTYISHFRNGDLKMNIHVNSADQIELLQFLPHQSMPRLKVLNYLSDNKKLSTLDTVIERLVLDYIQSPQNCGFSIGIFQNGKYYYYNYGEVKRNSKNLPSQNTIYEIGSVSKTFCGILLAKAILEKKVKATDDIRLYLPIEKYSNLEVKGKPIQLVHLSNHTSGLPRLPDDLEEQANYDALNPYKNYNKKMVYAFLKRAVLVSEPGKVCEYSNYGMALLGIILENIYNKSFDELVKENICMPYKMTNTAVNLTEEQIKLLGSGYNAEGKETPHWDLGDLSAAGGIKSNAFDMLSYLKQNLDEKDETLKLAHQSTFNNGSNIGMAWHIIKTKQGNKLIWHNGGTFGYSSFCGFIPEKNCAIVILSNSGTPVDPIALGILKYLQQ